MIRIGFVAHSGSVGPQADPRIYLGWAHQSAHKVGQLKVLALFYDLALRRILIIY